MRSTGRTFYKMSGSGNDFIMVDATREPAGELGNPTAIAALCARGTGVGADGIVFLERSNVADFRMTYLNSDGSRAALCGNASLCSVRLAAELGLVGPSDFHIETDAGVLAARLTEAGAEVDLQPVIEVQTSLPLWLSVGEQWSAFALAGVPHVTVRVDDVSRVNVAERGRLIRHDPSFTDGANVNFVSSDDSGHWRIRTYERGVEGETLACGTGSIATAILLAARGEIGDAVELVTRSGRAHRVRLEQRGDGAWLPSLSGEARLVFEGRFGEL
jgi:diaminopimelate epimerase